MVNGIRLCQKRTRPSDLILLGSTVTHVQTGDRTTQTSIDMLDREMYVARASDSIKRFGCIFDYNFAKLCGLSLVTSCTGCTNSANQHAAVSFP